MIHFQVTIRKLTCGVGAVKGLEGSFAAIGLRGGWCGLQMYLRAKGGVGRLHSFHTLVIKSCFRPIGSQIEEKVS